MAIAGDTGIVNARILSNGDGHVFAVGFVPPRDVPRAVEIFCLLSGQLQPRVNVRRTSGSALPLICTYTG